MLQLDMAAISADTGMDGKRVVAEYSTVVPRPGEVETVEGGSRLTLKDVLEIGATLVVDGLKELKTRRSEAMVDRSGKL
jgi:hypothetical protein